METRWSERAPSCIKNSTMVEEPEQSDASRTIRTSQGIWPNSRNNAVLIPRASHHRRGRRPFRQGEGLREKGQISPTFSPLFPRGRSGQRAQPMTWRTGLYGDGTRALAAVGPFFGGGWRDLDAMCTNGGVREPRRTETAGLESRGELRGQRPAPKWGPETALHSGPGAISRTRSSWYTACHSLQPGITSPLCQARYRERVKSIAAPELRLSRI